MDSQPVVQTSFTVALARVFWMLIGPGVLAFLAIAIASNAVGWFGAADIAFLAVLAAMLFARTYEFRSGQGQTSTGEPLTAADLRTYAFLTVLIGLAAWCIANVIGNDMAVM